MRLLSLAALVCGILSNLAVAGVSPDPLRSLSDLPLHWQGVAGDLFTKSVAVLDIERVTAVSRTEEHGRVEATYGVTGSLKVGDRELGVKELVLTQYSHGSKDSYDVLVRTDDELVMGILCSLRYDELSSTFKLQEIPHDGSRRFVLEAPAHR